MLRLISVFALAMLVLAPAPCAQKPGRGKGHQKELIAQGFGPADRSRISDYYRSERAGLPPGLARRNGDLPPGLEKQLRRNGALPPGLEKRLAPFPPEVESRLPPCPPDARRGLIGGIAVMYSTRTGLVLDAFAIIGR